MIGVQRPPAPKVLVDNETAWNDEAVASVEAAITAGQKPTYRWAEGRYGHGHVRAALKRMLHGKCAYCESRIAHITYEEVEHYRPKGAVGKKPALQTPGYYWLGYSWRNLLLSCHWCNAPPGKGTQFPVDSVRARRPPDDLNGEQPLLLDPTETGCNPEDHITFDVGHLEGDEWAFDANHVGEALPHNGSRRGRNTIDVCRLHRSELREERARRLEDLWDKAVALFDAYDRNDARRQKRWLGRIQDAVDDAAEYAGLARAFFRALGLL